MSKKLWFVQTEEGVEGEGSETPLQALVDYIELSEVDEKRVNEILEGHSEINYVVAYTREELDAMPDAQS